MSRERNNELISPDYVRPGSELEEIRIKGFVGRGYSSEVFSAENVHTRRRCAVKVFRPEFSRDVVRWGRCMETVRRIGQVAHSNMIEVYRFGSTEDGRKYWTADGPTETTLREVLAQQSPLPIKAVRTLLHDLCNSLAAVHRTGIAHGRLHGGNVLLVHHIEHPNAIRLTDYGIWHILPAPSDTSAQTLHPDAASAAFIAPELYRGQSPTIHSDIFSLCVLLYQMLTGQIPFVAETHTATMEKLLNEQPLPPSQLVNLPRSLEELLISGLEKDPRNRIPSIEALVSAADPSWSTYDTLPLAPIQSSRHRVLTDPELRLSDLGPAWADTGDHPAIGNLPITGATVARPARAKIIGLFVTLAVSIASFIAAYLWLTKK